MRHLFLAVLAALAAMLCMTPLARGASLEDGVRLVAPTQSFDGRTGGELLGDVWGRIYAEPRPDNPWFGNGDPCTRMGSTGNVVFIAHNESLCTVHEGTLVLIHAFFATCDNVSPPPDYGADEATQRACALAYTGGVQVGLVSVDGGEPFDLRKARYGVYSPQRAVQLPAANFLGIPPQPATFTAHGWVAVLAGLRPGLHTIRSENTFADGSYIFTKLVNVLPNDD